MLAATTIALLVLASAHAAVASTGHVDAVNLRIGTAGEGQTFPAVGVPFAMTFWTPETRSGEVKCIAPYYDRDRLLTGLRATHWISGSCMRDYGSFTLMPESGGLRLASQERATPFVHADEQMSPDRYAVHLRRDDVAVEMTGLTRSGLMSFRFARQAPAWVVVQNNGTAAGGWTAADPARGEIYGANPVRRLYIGEGKPAGFSGYFVIQFDHPVAAGGVWSGHRGRPGAGRQSTLRSESGAYVRFTVAPGETVRAKIGTSFVSVDEARRNVAQEIPGWDIGSVEQASRERWADVLDRIDVSSGSSEGQQIFYTALYHSFLHPRTFNDADGNYPQFGGGGQVKNAEGFTYYDDFSLWDTFRAVHPLFTLLTPQRDVDMIRSLLAKGDDGGFLPIFPAWNSYTSEMVGDHAVAVIEDAYAKGLRGFDAEEAYRLVRRNAMEEPPRSEYLDGKGRRALASYLRYGFVPLEDHVPDAFHHDEQVSRTLEYAYDDFLAGQLAAALGHEQDAAIFERRAGNWKSVFDPLSGYVRGRYADGRWAEPFRPNRTCSWVTEALPSQATFFVLHDIPGLIAAEGGPKPFVKKLDALFAGHFYDQGNEPSHHIAYLYDAALAAWKAQKHLHQVMTEQYTARPNGLIGNDDAGQMSAWYVFSALGFYPVTPGLPRYEIGTPLFDNAVLHLPEGKEFRIVAPGAGEGSLYIAAATLNGRPLHRAWLSHTEIVAGGELHFTMSRTPHPEWPGGSER